VESSARGIDGRLDGVGGNRRGGGGQGDGEPIPHGLLLQGRRIGIADSFTISSANLTLSFGEISADAAAVSNCSRKLHWRPALQQVSDRLDQRQSARCHKWSGTTWATHL